MKKIIFLMILITLFSFSSAYAFEDIMWDGQASVKLDKEIFGEDENITGKVIVYNYEYTPSFGQTIALQIGTGTWSYPSQFAEDNIIEEKKIDDLWILPRDFKTFNFSFAPKPAGTYHLDTYLWSVTSMFVGSDSIYYNPISLDFEVESEVKEKEIIINREKTKFNDTLGPVGFPVESNKEVNGKIVINNNYQTKNNLELNISVCEWSCALSENSLTKKINTGEIKKDEEKIVDFSFEAPNRRGAYEINMELKEGEEILSIYKNRLIVAGGTAKVRKVYLDSIKEGELSVTALISGSPDHFNNPDFKDFSLIAKIYEDGKELEEIEEKIDLITNEMVLGRTFEIESKEFDEICILVEKENDLHDKQCFNIYLDEAREAYKKQNPEVAKVTWEYNEPKKELEVNISKKETLNGEFRIISVGESIFKKTISEKKEEKFLIELDPGLYALFYDDFDAKKQIVEELFLGKETEQNLKASSKNPEDIECGAQVCKENEICDGKSFQSKEGTCCLGKCVPAIESNVLTNITPFIFWISILLIIASIIIFKNSVGRKKNE
jgi:hypothetical protein